MRKVRDVRFSRRLLLLLLLLVIIDIYESALREEKEVNRKERQEDGKERERGRERTLITKE